MTAADDVAAALIERLDSLDQMQLHKLLYLIQALSLAWFDTPAFPEKIEAWQYGPVVRGIAGRYKRFGKDPISEPVGGNPQNLDERLRWVVDYVVEKYGHLSGPALASLVKRSDGPWKVTRGDLPPDAGYTAEIPIALIGGFHHKYGVESAQLSEHDHELAERYLNGDSEALAKLFESATASRSQ